MAETKTVRLAAMIGPNGELVVDSCESPEGTSPDWAMLWDFTEMWECPESDIRRTWVEVEVPILGPNTVEALKGSADNPPTERT